MGDKKLSYFGEVRIHWRALVAALLGVSTGLSLNNYTAGLFGPHLIEAFAWPKSQYALVGALSLSLVLVLPFAGRMSDKFGVRRVVLIGIIGLPITFIAMAVMNGNLLQFSVLTVIQSTLGAFSTSSIYGRLIVDRFDVARGFGFAAILSGPPLIGAIANPLLELVIDEYGWRAGYFALAALCASGGILAFPLIPRDSQKHARPSHDDKDDLAASRNLGTFRADFAALLRSRVFWLVAGGMLLCNLPATLMGAQLKLMAMDSGASAHTAVWMMSLYAAGVMLGRFIFGISLDRFPPHLVAAIGIAIPGLGFLGVASSIDAPWVLAGSALLIGLAQGGEGDIAAYIVSRYFDLRQFNFIFSLIGSTMAAASAIGAIILSLTLRVSDSFTPFILFSAGTTLVGALFFLFIGKRPAAAPAESSLPALSRDGHACA